MNNIQLNSEIGKDLVYKSPHSCSTSYDYFKNTPLGKLHLAIPWFSLITNFSFSTSSVGRPPLFSPQGQLALMFLKHYKNCSDRALIESLNGNIYEQYFCGIYLKKPLKNDKIVSAIRVRLSKDFSLSKMESSLYEHWKNNLGDVSQITMDATCYESDIRYPTDTKLLGESVRWLYQKLVHLSHLLAFPLPKNQYEKWSRFGISYSKMRRKTKKKRSRLQRGLLRLLDKFITKLNDWLSDSNIILLPSFYKKYHTIKVLFEQQKYRFETGESPAHRIVSLDKPYLRPIVRGKDRKKVEFGAKVHKFQIGGISFIERIDFDAFHEGNLFQETIFKAQRMTKKKVKVAGADAIYATNANRIFRKKHCIITDFKPKGKKRINDPEKELRKQIQRERSTVLEGSFGREKAYYGLNRIKARTKKTEILWIVFGIHTANAVTMGKRMCLENENH